jgi:hypothetical protein
MLIVYNIFLKLASVLFCYVLAINMFHVPNIADCIKVGFDREAGCFKY